MAKTPDPWRGILTPPLDELPPGMSYPTVDATPGLVVEHGSTRFVGRVVRAEGDGVLVRGFAGRERLLRCTPGAFRVDGYPVTLVPVPVATAAQPAAAASRTASGSVAVDAAARVAQASRIVVEGKHDAELVERIWGDDLRVEGIVVENLEGVDRLSGYVAAFAPSPSRRLGVLVDHLVPGSKEERIAAVVSGPHVLVTGTPYVDVWQAVRPSVLGIDAWPEVERGRPWKEGICEALGFSEPYQLWARLLGLVRSWDDIETPLVHAVERLIDFVSVGPDAS